MKLRCILINLLGLVMTVVELFPTTPKYLITQHEKHVTVIGKPADLEALVFSYQDELWPEWRKHKGTVNLINQYVEIAGKQGKLNFWTADRLHAEAFRKSCLK